MKLQIGDWIRKENYSLFRETRNNVTPASEERVPFLQITSIGHTHTSLIINEIYFQKRSHLAKMEQEELDHVRKVWEECTLSETDQPIEIGSCIREDTNEPKNKFPEWNNSLRGRLFLRRMLNPNANYDAYKCGICSNYHLGKRKN
jgi:hypothetical protein